MPLVDWAAQVLQECAPLAAALDATHHSSDYSAALASARTTLAHPAQTPSARVLEHMAREHGNSFTGFPTRQSALARDVLLALPWSDTQQARFAALAEESVAAQKAIEAADTLPFEEWRQHYMAAQGLGL
jgi:glutamate--cysteine ligase